MTNKFLKVFATIVLAAIISSVMASSSREALPASEGQLLVESFFDGGEFNTGDWGNDVSFLLPFKWTLDTNDQFTLFSMAEHVRTREAHWPPYQIVDGRLRYRTYKWSVDSSVDFLPSELYELQFTSGRTMLVYHNEQTSRIRHSTGDVIRIFTLSSWYELDIGTNGVPNKIIHKGWPEGLFADKTLKSVRSVIPHRFRGPKAKPVKEKDRVQVRIEEYVATKSSWRMDRERKAALADVHRKYVSKVLATDDVTNIFLVACDVNHDGICDAYVSSNQESVNTDKYKWSLYLGDGHGFVRQKESERFSATRTEDIYFETDVISRKDGFFRIDRVNMPAYVVILAELEGRPESWSYLHHDNFVRKFRREDGMSNADYYGCLENSQESKGPGIASIRDMFFFSHYGLALVNAERLGYTEVKISQGNNINSYVLSGMIDHSQTEQE